MQHPKAADTVDGVEQWWLNGREIHLAVERALEMLVEQSVLRRSIEPQGPVVYSAGRRRPPRR